MIEKHILVPQRLRRPPASGWSWVDRRFLREHGDYLSREAMLLYFFLSAVADRHGLSFYSDNTLAVRLRLSQPELARAREELLERDLIAHQLPLVQVLSLPAPSVRRRAEPGQGLMLLGDVFRQAATATTPSNTNTNTNINTHTNNTPTHTHTNNTPAHTNTNNTPTHTANTTTRRNAP